MSYYGNDKFKPLVFGIMVMPALQRCSLKWQIIYYLTEIDKNEKWFFSILLFGPNFVKNAGLNLVIIFNNISLKFDQNAGLTPCDSFNIWPKFDKKAGLTPCDLLNIWQKKDKKAGLTLCDLFNIWPKLDKNAGLTPCDSFNIGSWRCKMKNIVIFGSIVVEPTSWNWCLPGAYTGQHASSIQFWTVLER